MVPMLENVEEQLIESTQKALNEMIAMREQEGTSLANDLKTRCHNLRTSVLQIKQQSKGISVEWRNKLLQRLAESGLEIDCENEAVRRGVCSIFRKVRYFGRNNSNSQSSRTI